MTPAIKGCYGTRLVRGGLPHLQEVRAARDGYERPHRAHRFPVPWCGVRYEGQPARCLEPLGLRVKNAIGMFLQT